MFAAAGSTAGLGNRNSAVIYKLESGAESQVQSKTIRRRVTGFNRRAPGGRVGRKNNRRTSVKMAGRIGQLCRLQPTDAATLHPRDGKQVMFARGK
jgi:hypothetical protein